jgi:hypothetical protein
MKKTLATGWLLLITVILVSNLSERHLNALIIVLFSMVGSVTAIWLADAFCDWVSPLIKKALIEGLRKQK